MDESDDDPFLAIFPRGLLLDDSCAIRLLVVVQVEHLATKGVYKVFVRSEVFKPELLPLDSWDWFFENGGWILLTVGRNGQVLAGLPIDNVTHIIASFEYVKPLVRLVVVIVDDQGAKRIFVLANV